MVQPRCGTCHFWREAKGIVGTDMRCHRYPPQRITLTVFYGATIGSSTRMPRTEAHGWCGEWKSRARP